MPKKTVKEKEKKASKKQTKKKNEKTNILKEKPNPIDIDQTTIIDLENKEIIKDSIIPAIIMFVFGVIMLIISIIMYLIAEGIIPNFLYPFIK